MFFSQNMTRGKEGPIPNDSSIYSKLHYHNSEDIRRRLCSLKRLDHKLEWKYLNKKGTLSI